MPPRCLLVLLLLCALPARSATLLLEAPTQSASLASHLEALEDPARALTLDDIRQAPAAARFRPVATEGVEVNFGYSASAYWLRLPLAVAPGAAGEWLLEIAFPSLDGVEVFPPGAGERLAAGDLQPFSARPYAHRNLVFPLSLQPGAEQFLYLRVVSGGSLTVPATLWRPRALQQHDQRNYALLSVYYGILLALLLYNLLLYASLRERVYLEYVCFVLAMAVGQASLNGFGNQFLWPDWPAWGNVALPSGMSATGLFGALFTRSFLDTARGFRVLDRIILALAAAFAFSALSPLVFSYRFAAIFTSLTGLAFSAVAVAGGLLCLRRRMPGARYFLLAWTILLVGVGILAMRNLSWLPTTPLTSYAMQIGSAVEMLLLSFALADRIQVMRAEKDVAQGEALAAKQAMVESLQRSERELELRVEALERAERAERTAAEEQAKRREQAEFLSMVSHELKTPLAVIDSAVQALGYRRGDGDADAARRHGRIRQAVAQLNRLLEQALSRERGEGAPMAPRLAPIPVEQLMEDAASSAAAPAHRLEIGAQPGAVCTGDRTLLRVALGNLIDNALKYAPPGTPISVHAEAARREERPGVLFTEENAVAGLPAEAAPHMFEKYWRGPNSQGKEGVGLGLYLVRAIARAHGGEAECRLDGGRVRFSIWIPQQAAA